MAMIKYKDIIREVDERSIKQAFDKVKGKPLDSYDAGAAFILPDGSIIALEFHHDLAQNLPKTFDPDAKKHAVHYAIRIGKFIRLQFNGISGTIDIETCEDITHEQERALRILLKYSDMAYVDVAQDGDTLEYLRNKKFVPVKVHDVMRFIKSG